MLAGLRGALDYNPDTGELTWKHRRGSAQAGQLAGCVNAMGYHVVRFEKKLWYGHRLAWLITYGEWPPHEVDHINGNPADNRIANLRLATHAENGRNIKRHVDNKSGVKGVSWHAQSGKWGARIKVDGKAKRIGLFDTPELAGEAYDRAANELHSTFARTNKMMGACHG